jgi:hypothetical protein
MAGFTLKTWLVRTEPHPGGHVLRRDAVRDTEALVSFCSWCKRIDASGTWCELDEGLRRLGQFRAEPS